MKRTNYLVMMLAVVAAFMITSCSHTAITSTWHDVNEKPQSFDKVAIVVMAPSKANRGTLENAIATQFRENGINAVSTMGIFPNAGQVNEKEIDKEEIEKVVREKVEKNNIDAMLIIGLLDTKEESYYVEGTTSTYGTPYVGSPYYGGYGSPYSYPISGYAYNNYSYSGYYAQHYSTVSTPGYYVNTTTYYVESSLFGIDGEKMLWSAQSETTDPVSIARESETFAELIVKQMLSDRAIEAK